MRMLRTPADHMLHPEREPHVQPCRPGRMDGQQQLPHLTLFQFKIEGMLSEPTVCTELEIFEVSAKPSV